MARFMTVENDIIKKKCVAYPQEDFLSTIEHETFRLTPQMLKRVSKKLCFEQFFKFLKSKIFAKTLKKAFLMNFSKS
jgi:hypothetical protein